MIVKINVSWCDAECEVISCDDAGGGRSCNFCENISRVMSKYIDFGRGVM